MIQKVFLLLMLGTLAAAVVIFGTHRSPSETSIDGALAFLAEREDVRWHEVEGNDVVISFRKASPDLTEVVRRAAVRASRTGDGEFHVWGVVKAKRGWRGGDEPAATYDVVARNGQIP